MSSEQIKGGRGRHFPTHHVAAAGSVQLGAAKPLCALAPQLDALRLKYVELRNASTSPVREEVEQCLAQLEELMPVVWACQDVGAVVLAVEMEMRRVHIIEALNSGTEL